ncbi:MAG: hypothetical protein ACXVKA_08600 [Acidimicrobiia bacterium]
MRSRQWKLPVIGTALAVGAALLAGCAASAQQVVPSGPAAPSTPVAAALRERIGISAGSATIWEPDDAVRQRAIKAIADTGAHWLAMDMNWDSVNGAGPSVFRWQDIDRFVREVRAYGLKIVAIEAYSPPWAVPPNCPALQTHCLPASPEPYATFAAAAATRYGSLSAIPDLRNAITSWQIWNEPNHYPFVQPVVDVAAYTNLLKRAYVEIKKADPAATVIAGGTSPAPDDPSGRDMSPVTFLRGIYANGGQGFFDAFGHHPYSFPCSPLQSAPWNAFTQTQYLHDVMVQNGDGAKKIWATESGAPTATNVGPCAAGPNVSVTEATQAQYVADYFKGWTQDFGSFTGPLIWFQIRDNGTDPAYFDDHFGLVRRDFSEKPAYQTFKKLLAG